MHTLIKICIQQFLSVNEKYNGNNLFSPVYDLVYLYALSKIGNI